MNALCLWFWKKIKLCQVSLNSIFYDNGISFPFGMLQGLDFGQKLVFTMKHIENRKCFIFCISS